jgi:hypothetical protein
MENRHNFVDIGCYKTKERKYFQREKFIYPIETNS